MGSSPLSTLPAWKARCRCPSRVWWRNCARCTELAPDLEDQLNQRRARLRRLGLINPEAARDYEAESERYSFLNAQVQDLRQAEADLRQVIAELDELTRQEFSRTYTAVDKQFRTIFTRLFGGGSARPRADGSRQPGRDRD